AGVVAEEGVLSAREVPAADAVRDDLAGDEGPARRELLGIVDDVDDVAHLDDDARTVLDLLVRPALREDARAGELREDPRVTRIIGDDVVHRAWLDAPHHVLAHD